ncbi:MAG TPA: hypothetical protein VIP30_12445 [Stenotrophomonas sp.]
MRPLRRLQALGVLLFDRGLLRAIFEHTRNVAISSVITAAGLQVVNPAEQAWFTAPTLAGYLVAAIGLMLLLLNFIDGLWRLARFRSHWFWQIALTLAYAVLAWRVAQLVLLLKTGAAGAGSTPF